MVSPAFLAGLPLSKPNLSSIRYSQHRKCVFMSAGKPARVAIAGAGIGGLSAALSLIRTPGTGVEHVTIFEPREGLDKSQGAALNVSGGAAILLREYGIPLRDIANPMVTVVARSTGGRKLFEVDIEQAINGVPAARELLYHDGRPTLMTVMRDELQRLLTEALGDNVEIRRGKDYRVTGVQSSKDGARFMLANGERTEEYDLVIGADGLGSAVRPHVSGSTEKAKYTGFRILWGVAPDTQMTRGRLEQWFGDGGYGFRYTGGPKGKENEMLVLSFKDSEMAAENEVYARGTLKDDFRKRLLKTGMPQSIFDLLDRCDRFIETGVYSHQVMKKWSKDGVCTLVGDSAHAMPPFLGQGSNQAIQDAHALGLAVSRIGKDYATLEEALGKYEAVRRVPVDAILKTSSIIGTVETQGGFIGQAFRNNLFWFLGAIGGAGRIFIQSSLPRVS